jgi:hypothetical protein
VSRDDVDELLNRIAVLSPMPADDDPSLTVDRLQSYDEVIQRVHLYLGQQVTSLDQRLIGALINSFGYGDAYEAYWSTVHALEKYPIDQLRIPLHDALRKGPIGARMWSAIMLGRQRNPNDLPLLISALWDSAPRVRYNTLVAIAKLNDPRAAVAVEGLFNDPDEAVQKKAHETARELKDLEGVGRG